MKITSIRAVVVDGLGQASGSSGREAAAVGMAGRQSWVHGPVASPMSRYPRYAGDRTAWMPDWPVFGCVVEAEDGTTGFALATGGRAVAALIDDYLGPRLAGEDAMATEKVYDMAVRLCAPFGAVGLASYAVSAIDLALWDLKGKVLGRPVYELLGGPVRDKLDCYATGADTDWYMKLGFRAVKLPCPGGAAGLRGVVELVEKTREQIGDDVELMLDCWMAFDVEGAVRLAEALRPYRVRWLEECLPPADLDGHAQLRARLPWQPLATGEHWYGTAPFMYAARHNLVDIFQPDIQWVGGLTALVKICAIAEAAGLTVIPHAAGNTPYGQHACLALPAISTAEFFIPTPPGQPLRDAYGIPDIPTPVNGWLTPSGAPGFGLDIPPEQLHPYQ